MGAISANVNDHLWEICNRKLSLWDVSGGPNREKAIEGTSALYKAVQVGDPKIIKLLIQNRACLNSGRKWEGTYRFQVRDESILHCAVMGGHLEVCKLLLEARADPMSALTREYVVGPDKCKGKRSSLFAAASK